MNEFINEFISRPYCILQFFYYILNWVEKGEDTNYRDISTNRSDENFTDSIPLLKELLLELNKNIEITNTDYMEDSSNVAISSFIEWFDVVYVKNTGPCLFLKKEIEGKFNIPEDEINEIESAVPDYIIYLSFEGRNFDSKYNKIKKLYIDNKENMFVFDLIIESRQYSFEVEKEKLHAIYTTDEVNTRSRLALPTQFNVINYPRINTRINPDTNPDIDINDEEDMNDEDQEGGGGGKIPLLDGYYNYFFINTPKNNLSPINLNPQFLTFNNIVAIKNYLNIFSRFEMSLCITPDEYEQSFERINGIEITNYIELYLLFYYLINDFKTYHDKICYGLLEYFLNSPETKNLNISCDLDHIIYYLFYNYKALPTSAYTKLHDEIEQNTTILKNPIFKNTKEYFKKLYVKINKHSKQITNGIEKKNKVGINFVNNYLNIYGFTNMNNSFVKILKTIKPTKSSKSVSKKTTLTAQDVFSKKYSKYYTQKFPTHHKLIDAYGKKTKHKHKHNKTKKNKKQFKLKSLKKNKKQTKKNM